MAEKEINFSQTNYPLVSVIIPAYNAEHYVESAVRSIMEQTYTNLEILCCDDCSTDKTFSILKKLAAEDSRIKILRNETNLGVVGTLNKLVSETSGTYIARMDADDICLTDRIARQIAFLQQNPQIDFCGCNAFHINDDGKTIGKTTLPESYDDVRFFLPYYSTFYHPAIFARAEVLKQNAYDKDFLHAEDYELWCRLIFAKGMKGANLKERLLKYRINLQGVSKQNTEKQMENSARIFDRYGIVEKSFLDAHNNLFFTHSEKISEHFMAYIKKVKKELSSKKFSYAYNAYGKMLFHFYSAKQWNLFFYMLLTPLGIYSFFKILKRKGGKEE